MKIKVSTEIDGYLKADHLKISTTSIESVDVGEIVWNQVDGTFDMGLIGGVTLQAGQEMHIYGKATEAISNGEAVMFAGVQGDHLLIARADATIINANPEYLIGVSTQSFTTNQFGYVTTLGNVRGLNTLAYTLGTILYYNSESATDGLLTATEPTAPNAKIEVAAVVRVHGTQGILLVRPHVMPRIKDLQDIYAPSPTQAKGLFWNNTNSRYENYTVPEILGYTPANDSLVVHLTGNETITGTKTFNKVGTDTSIEAFNTTGGYSVYLENDSLAGSSLFANNLSTGIGIDVGNSSTGIGISSINSLSGIGIFSDNYGIGKGIYSNNAGSGVSIYSSTVFGDGIVSNGTAAGLVFVGQNNGVNTLTINKEGNVTASSLIISGGATFGGNLGVGTLTPVGKFNVFTGISGNTLDIVNQQNGSISFSNKSVGTTSPTISGKSGNSSGLAFLGATSDASFGSDISFNIRKIDNTDFTTLTTSAYNFSRFNTTLIDVLRNGNTTFYGNVYAPIYYDSDNTSYYVNPASTSRLSTLTVTESLSAPIYYDYNDSAYYVNPATYSSLYSLQVAGALTCSSYIATPILYDSNNSSYYFDGTNTSTSIRVAGGIQQYYSDERLKDIKNNIKNPLEKVLSLNGFYYEPNEIAQSFGYVKKMEVGVSAQEVEAILPEIIQDAPIGHGYKTLDYSKLVPLLIEAIKEQQTQIEELKNKFL